MLEGYPLYAAIHHAWRKALHWADLVAALRAVALRRTEEAAVEETAQAARAVRAEGYELVKAAHLKELIC